MVCWGLWCAVLQWDGVVVGVGRDNERPVAAACSLGQARPSQGFTSAANGEYILEQTVVCVGLVK